jgi:hypothetical protein
MHHINPTIVLSDSRPVRRHDECLCSDDRRPKPGWLVQCEPGLGDEGCAAPARDQAIGIGNRIDAAARLRVGIAGEDKAVLFREIGVVVAQIEVEGLVSEGDAGLPVEIGRQENRRLRTDSNQEYRRQS